MPRFLDMTDFAAAVHGLLPCAHILDRWARHGAIGAEHAAFSFLRLEPRSASLAFVQELAGIGRHIFGGSMRTVGASDSRNELGHVGGTSLINEGSR
jgi:hypothetical protein